MNDTKGDGPKYDTRLTGLQGPKGETGLTGPQGVPGIQGLRGPQGDRGEISPEDKKLVSSIPQLVKDAVNKTEEQKKILGLPLRVAVSLGIAVPTLIGVAALLR